MGVLLEADGISFAYEDRLVIDDVSLTVDSNDFLGLVGPNGGGKTTLLKLLLGLKRPQRGSIRLFGEPIDGFTEGERIGYIPQERSDLDRSMPITVREVVSMGRYPHVGLNSLRTKDKALVVDAIETVGLTEEANTRIGKLSGGQRQRAAIARMLAGEAELLALDEPTVGIDAEAREHFYELLTELHQSGVTIILIEHDLGLVIEHADRVACINKTLRYLGNSDSFLESDALVETFGTAGKALQAFN